ncbi:hypothetical protein FRACYDRAFT_243829 [Fragilariopsis cylindrus CCMP1102]|uniref:Uncharacterized protein n=1 Tax=Fragilariopsis cylindrus CCMP1102 TaxID=635003 RepID=A0A1E7F308_9STRA|nr:hypothetical protein FRACYDRAFT_243829 [Fragilariopsis cylindrus CCMP1102]|eukprot:OEU12578.1 hypothetical protein FRACYDRAFT_243829 [Fragilariopsis cylindrus CCMP1102]
MSPFKNPKSPSTPAAVHRIGIKAKIAKDKASKAAATAARASHDEQADFHLIRAQAAAAKEAALDIEIAQGTSLQGICKDSSTTIYELDINNVARLLVSPGYNEDVLYCVVAKISRRATVSYVYPRPARVLLSIVSWTEPSSDPRTDPRTGPRFDEPSIGPSIKYTYKWKLK